MQTLRVDNYIIETPLIEIVNQLRLSLTNGKLKVVKPWHAGEDNIVVTCPNRHHKNGHETSPAMNIYVGDNYNIPYGFCKCWACDFQTSFVGFVTECFECSEDFAKKWLIDKFGILAGTKISLGPDIHIKQRKAKAKLPMDYLDQFQSWHPYLAQRKLSREVCEFFKVKYDPIRSEVIFPCFDIAGNILMAPRRSITYKNFIIDKDLEKGLYCYHEIAKRNCSRVLICEGLIDTLTGWSNGVPTIGTMGNPSDSQINLINRSNIKILFAAFDNDHWGNVFYNRIISKLDPRILVTKIELPVHCKDINDLSFDEWKELITKYNLPQEDIKQKL